VRSIQVVEESSGDTTRAEHVVGIDESGQVTGEGQFALVAVRCPRSCGERLAELLIECDLSPWKGKWQTLGRNVSASERRNRVEQLLGLLEAAPISWQAAVGYTQYSIHHKAAAVCVLTKQTITGSPEFRGDALMIPDGAPSMYGDSQQHLRTQAAQMFDGSFQSTFGGVYVTGLAGADLTYPEATAADYLAGYLREAIVEGGSPDSLPDQVVRFDANWREPLISPLPFYRIRGASGEYGSPELTRVVAWITGRQPDDEAYDASSQWTNRVQMLDSEAVQQYLLTTVAP